MALSRRSGARLAANIWPGFVDAMTALLLVMMFVLSIFMIVQFTLRQTISGQASELDDLSAQVSGLAQALGFERNTNADLSNQVGQLGAELDDASAQAKAQSALIASLGNERDAAQAQVASFEEQVAGLMARNSDLTSSLQDSQKTLEDQAGSLQEATSSIAQLEAAQKLEISRKEAAQLALARVRSEVDAKTEQARLTAAKADALQALADNLQSKVAENAGVQDALDASEKSRLLEAAAAEQLRAELKDSRTELTAMTLTLEEQRRKAEDTLTLLAAAEAARRDLDTSQAESMTKIEAKNALLAQANDLLSKQKGVSAEAQRKVELLNRQTADLRQRLDALQGLLDESAAKDAAAKVQLQSLGSNLNAALARVAAEKSARLEVEARENARLKAEANDLRGFRSEFFGRIRQVLGDRQGVKVVGDRFVFSSEVLFAPGSANLGASGKVQISKVASLIRQLEKEIPKGINWILRVDGHTDKTPLSPNSQFADNWELSQARALSVVKYLINNEQIPANRLAATGFGEFQPIDNGTTPEALARNRRIELKLTEK